MAKVSSWRRNDDSPGLLRVPRDQHTLSRGDISANALKVLYRLKKMGFKAFLVGGGVRDVLLQADTKDFDIATDATPEQVREAFNNSRVIGRRFKIVHVVFQQEIVEVSTFRAAEQVDVDSAVRHENTFGTLEEDVWRRDFTINALYYDINDFSIVDYTGGFRDLQERVLRIIGEPAKRFAEDPVRLLRAIRLSAKLDLTIEAKANACLLRSAELLATVPRSRLLHEFEKLFFSGYAAKAFAQLERYDYLRVLLPEVADVIVNNRFSQDRRLIEAGLKETDVRYKAGKTLNAGFLFAVMLWPVFMLRFNEELENQSRFNHALHEAVYRTLDVEQTCIAIPRRYVAMIRSVWVMQFNMERRRPKRIAGILKHRYYRAAIDLLELRADVDSELRGLAKWWRKVGSVGEVAREKMIARLGGHHPSKGKRNG